MNERWSVGLLHDPQLDDAEFSDLTAAMVDAEDKSIDRPVAVFAVWDIECEVVAIFTGGDKYILG